MKVRKKELMHKILPNPICTHVDEAADIAKKEKCDFIIENNNDIVNTKKMVSIIANKCNITKRLQ